VVNEATVKRTIIYVASDIKNRMIINNIALSIQPETCPPKNTDCPALSDPLSDEWPRRIDSPWTMDYFLRYISKFQIWLSMY